MSGPPIRLLLLTAAGCRYCDDARLLLARLGAEYRVAVEELPAESDEGRDLAVREGVLFPPGLFVEGEFLQYGRPSERKLRARLDQVARRRATGAPA